MKRKAWGIFMVSMAVAIMLIATSGFAALTGPLGHERYIYPVVRVQSDRSSGSGTIL